MIIDQLPLLGGDVQGTDEFPIERGTTTYKTTQAALIKTATDAAAAAQAAADDAQDTADEANAKGLPPGGTAGQVLTKADSADYSASWEDPSGGGNVTADMLGIVIDGNSTPVGASAGQYVIVKNSTISGITDGLYNARLIPANTAIDDTYLSAVSEGGFNLLLAGLSVENGSNTNGYYTKFPDGTLVQWMHQKNMDLSVAANSTAVKAIAFPISFVNTSYTVLVSAVNTSAPSDRSACPADISAANWININFQNKVASAWTVFVNFIAIGRWK